MKFKCNLSSRLDNSEVIVKCRGSLLTAASPRADPEGLNLFRVLPLVCFLLLNCQDSNKSKNYVSP